VIFVLLDRFARTFFGRFFSPPSVFSVTGGVSVRFAPFNPMRRRRLRSCRRLSRLTNAFSKKLENFKAAVALHYAYYNFVKIHQTIRCTPAMEAGVANSAWTVQDLITMTGA
jgi:hypothetical protein